MKWNCFPYSKLQRNLLCIEGLPPQLHSKNWIFLVSLKGTQSILSQYIFWISRWSYYKDLFVYLFIYFFICVFVYFTTINSFRLLDNRLLPFLHVVAYLSSAFSLYCFVCLRSFLWISLLLNNLTKHILTYCQTKHVEASYFKTNLAPESGLLLDSILRLSSVIHHQPAVCWLKHASSVCSLPHYYSCL